MNERIPSLVVAVCTLLGLCPVAALVAWAYRLGSFAGWFWALSFPSSVVLLAVALVTGRGTRSWYPYLSRLFAHGAVGGVLGAVAYDLVRVPFLAVGLRLMTPIDSYGVLMAGAHVSSPLTSFAGWWYHFSDGIGFGIAYAVVMRGRNWKWGLVWGMSLETIALLTPLGGYYNLRADWVAIVGAYLGHLAYGTVLGKTVELVGPDAAARGRRPLSPRTPAVVLVLLLAYLVVWLKPWTTPLLDAQAGALLGAPVALVVSGKFHPEWLRVADGGCATLVNRDSLDYRLTGQPGHVLLPARSSLRLCFHGPRVHRVKTAGAWSGGFVLVDPAGT